MANCHGRTARSWLAEDEPLCSLGGLQPRGIERSRSVQTSDTRGRLGGEAPGSLPSFLGDPLDLESGMPVLQWLRLPGSPISKNKRWSKEAEQWKASAQYPPVVVRTYETDWIHQQDASRMLGLGYAIVGQNAVAQGSRGVVSTQVRVTYQLRAKDLPQGG